MASVRAAAEAVEMVPHLRNLSPSLFPCLQPSQVTLAGWMG